MLSNPLYNRSYTYLDADTPSNQTVHMHHLPKSRSTHRPFVHPLAHRLSLLLSRFRPDTAGHDPPLPVLGIHRRITTIATPFVRMQTNHAHGICFSQAKCSQSVGTYRILRDAGHEVIHRSFFCYLHASTYIEYPSFLSPGHAAR